MPNPQLQQPAPSTEEALRLPRRTMPLAERTLADPDVPRLDVAAFTSPIQERR